MSIQVSDSSYKANKYTVNFPLTEGFSCSGVLIPVASYTPFGNKKINKMHKIFSLPVQIASLWTLLQRSPKESTIQFHFQIPARCKWSRQEQIKKKHPILKLPLTIGQFFWFINQPRSKLLDTHLVFYSQLAEFLRQPHTAIPFLVAAQV